MTPADVAQAIIDHARKTGGQSCFVECDPKQDNAIRYHLRQHGVDATLMTDKIEGGVYAVFWKEKR